MILPNGQHSFLTGRTLVWFSCGAASAVAAKLTLEEIPDADICNCDMRQDEHDDNIRFMSDVSKWLERPIRILRSTEFYGGIYQVFREQRFLKGPNGAPCTKHLKRYVREAYQWAEDTHVFGLTADEADRIAEFELYNPTLRLKWILQERGITKQDCFKIIRDAGIRLPAMYFLGYKNNNCIGCVKGGAGYWNKIKRDFPEHFARMAAMERELGFALLKIKGKPCFLDELPPNVGRYESEADMSCGPQCATELQEKPLPLAKNP